MTPSVSRVATTWLLRQIFAARKDGILSLFHHIHHEGEDHKVHHCGGDHKGKDLNYTIEHCSCGKHTIDKETAVGHGTQHGDDLLPVTVTFKEKCPDGGWHIESGVIDAG